MEHQLEENLKRALDNQPPLDPSVLRVIIARFSLDVPESKVLMVVGDIREAITRYYHDVLEIISIPRFDISAIRQAKKKKKEAWEFILSKVLSLG